MPRTPAPPAPFDRYTAHHHRRAVTAQGVVLGVFTLKEVVARKGLEASDTHVLLMMLVPALAQVVGVVWHPVRPGTFFGRRPFRSLGMPAFLLLPLLLLPAFRGATAFTVLMTLCGAASMLLLPVQNAILATNYGSRTRGRRFGAAITFHALAIAATSAAAGWTFDKYPNLWPLPFALAGVAAVVGYRQWGRLRRRRPAPPPRHLEQHTSPWRALRHDRAFLAFEICFTVYGLGWLMLEPVLPLYLVDDRNVTYTEAGLARGTVFWIAMAAGGAVLGRLADRVGLLRTCALSFLLLAAFPVLLERLEGSVGLYAAHAVFGIAMSGVQLAWNLGPILMARGRDPRPYLEAHLALVGVRALVAMVGGLVVYRAFGHATVFRTVVVLEVAAAVLMALTAWGTGRRWRTQDAYVVERPATPR